MTHKEFVPPSYTPGEDSGSTVWMAPSNIALIKYWGKRDLQLPANPSLSFTLTASATTTKLLYKKREYTNEGFSFDVVFDGVPEPSFRPKIESFLNRAYPYLPFLREYHFTIETSNTFPHSSGIASSASGMAALSLCLCDLEQQWSGAGNREYYDRKASFLARLGSGSAARSVSGPLMEWGRHENIPGSSDLYGIRYPFDTNKVFHTFRDTILLVDKGQKQVSSTLGHGLMNGHPYAASRFSQAIKNLDTLKTILASGDLEGFIAIVEEEALSLHAMMMTSRPYFILMKPNTLRIIAEIWSFRESEKIPVCFTLDAGANVHLLYPDGFKEQVDNFIKENLADFCANGQYICDQIGFGAKKL